MISLLTYPLSKALGDEAALRMLAENGFPGIDYSMHAYSLDSPIYRLPEKKLIRYFENVRALMRELGLTACQLHTHYPTYVENEPDENERRFRAVVSGIRAAQILGSPYAVAHPIMLDKPLDSELRRATWELNRQFYTRLIPVLRECGVKLAIENMFLCRGGLFQPVPISTAADLSDYIDRMNDIAGEALFVACLDTGHAHLLGMDIAQMPAQLGGRLRLLHLHDNLRSCDQHTAPYLGSLPWAAFLDALRSSGYQGHVSFEAHGFLRAFPPELLPGAVRLLAETGRYFEKRLRPPSAENAKGE
ncbi:MAG: sugar phosphate isomerase/epimerase [Clostridiales bacterium]|nr:sugar phosphate isomerase/epimerase [Clostridiales bacterium]MDO4350059.1 sugar phosphate isomerase/epimerase [Eubacteriales bacterium]MDY4009211.1 sugar phosphate isomerase/epimerase [Candidatus Limiplasma sp.]